MSKIYFQGTFGAYSHLAALSIDPKAEILPCKTFDDCFNKASEEPDSRIIIPESNRITGNIGIYCYSRDCLEKFVHLNQSKNEIENRLEQLRALDNNIDINVSLAKSSPIGVDTEEDYLALKKIMEYKN